MGEKTKSGMGFFGLGGEEDDILVLEIEEVKALLKFAAENGCSDKALINELSELTTDYGSEEDKARKEELATKIIVAYTKLTELMDGVNGRNILAGRNILRHTFVFMGGASFTFVFCILTLAVGEWVRNEPIEYTHLWTEVAVHVLTFFTPFLWGALGAYIQILKRITDFAAENRFDPYKFQGWITRLTLGAILGGTITYVIDPAAFGEVTLSATAIAFLTGMGSRVIYGGLQRIIQILGEKMNLDRLHEASSSADPVVEFLSGELTTTDKDNEKEKYEVIAGLLQQRAK